MPLLGLELGVGLLGEGVGPVVVERVLDGHPGAVDAVVGVGAGLALGVAAGVGALHARGVEAGVGQARAVAADALGEHHEQDDDQDAADAAAGLGAAGDRDPRRAAATARRPTSRCLGHAMVSSRALGLKRMGSPRPSGHPRSSGPRSNTLTSLMITAQHLEVRAGARLLMENVTFRVAPGDKIGLVGRNGAGKTTLTRILAGDGLPASGSVHATGSVGYLPQDPRTGDPEVLARERILSARGLDDVVRRLRAAEAEMGSDDPAKRERAMRRYERADADLHAGGGYAAESEAAQIAQSLGIDDRMLDPAAADPVRWPAPPGRAGPHPVLRRRDAAARRADQPPRRRLDRLAARVPQGSQGRPGRDQPRHRAARDHRQQGAPPRRQPGRDRRLQHGLVGVPRPAGDRRAAPQARAARTPSARPTR